MSRGAGYKPEHLAYVIYTSGLDWDVPKGFLVNHSNLVHFDDRPGSLPMQDPVKRLFAPFRVIRLLIAQWLGIFLDSVSRRKPSASYRTMSSTTHKR